MLALPAEYLEFSPSCGDFISFPHFYWQYFNCYILLQMKEGLAQVFLSNHVFKLKMCHFGRTMSLEAVRTMSSSKVWSMSPSEFEPCPISRLYLQQPPKKSACTVFHFLLPQIMGVFLFVAYALVLGHGILQP